MSYMLRWTDILLAETIKFGWFLEATPRELDWLNYRTDYHTLPGYFKPAQIVNILTVRRLLGLKKNVGNIRTFLPRALRFSFCPTSAANYLLC